MPNHRRLWPAITAVLIGLPVLYISGFAPACWIGRNQGPGRLSGVIAKVYWPLGQLVADEESPVRRPLAWYAGLIRSPGDETTLDGVKCSVYIVPDGPSDEWVAVILDQPDPSFLP